MALSYSIKARALPALIVVFPVSLTVSILFPAGRELWALSTAAFSLIGGSAILVLLGELGRDLGKHKEKELFINWGGKPTTRMLRHADSTIDAHTKTRYHNRLRELVPSLTLLNRAQEEQHPGLADQRYEGAIKYLLEATRDRKKFPLLFEELKSYGFRRNLWGMKTVGLVLSIFSLIVFSLYIIAALYQAETVKPILFWGTIANLIIILFWIVCVKPSWVRDVADAYAVQLLAACDKL